MGGGIAYIMQRSAINKEDHRRSAEQREAQQALGQSLLIKTIRIQSNIAAIQKYITSSFDEAKNKGYNGKPWQIVRPLASIPPRIDFSTDQLSLLLSLRDSDLFNRLSQLDGIYNNFLDILSTFNDRKSALNDLLPGVVVEGTVLTMPLPDDQALKMLPIMHDVDQLIGYLQARAEVDHADADEALKRLALLLNERLDLGFSIAAKAAVPDALIPRDPVTHSRETTAISEITGPPVNT